MQEAIVEGERGLATSHPAVDVKRTLKGMLKDDERFLKDLRRLGRQHDATGVAEDVTGVAEDVTGVAEVVAEALVELMETTASSAGEAESEAYEAHAVPLALKRKQQGSASAMVMIAREQGDTGLRDVAHALERGQKTNADILSESLGALAVRIAQQERATA